MRDCNFKSYSPSPGKKTAASFLNIVLICQMEISQGASLKSIENRIIISPILYNWQILSCTILYIETNTYNVFTFCLIGKSKLDFFKQQMFLRHEMVG